MSKSICIVTPSLNGGGAERIAVNLANYYSHNGYRVCMVVFDANGPYRKQLSSKVKLYDLSSRARYSALKLINVLRREKPRLILSVIRDSNILVGLVSLFLSAEIIFREANTMDQIFKMPKLKKWLYIFLMRLAYKQADKIIANSDDTMQDLVINKVTNSKKISVIGNPVLAMEFEEAIKENLTHKWLGNSDYKTLLNVGRLHKQKNQALLLRAFSTVRDKIPNSRLIILGEGGEKQNLFLLIRQLGLADYVDILPFQLNPYAFFREADVFVLTSDWEGFGNVIVEAMASMTAVISTNCPGGPRMILNNGEFGTLTKPGDAKNLASAIINELENPKKLKQLEESRDRASEFTVQHIAEKYLEI